MGFNNMRELPNLVKPVSLLLVILQTIFVFLPATHPFIWFVILTTILMLIICVLVFAIFFVDFSPVTEAPQWWLAECLYSAIFCVCSAVNTFYFLVNIFVPGHFKFFLILSTGTSVLLFLVWGFNAFVWFRNRGSSASTSHATNQATATPAPYPTFPAGANPA